MYARNPYDTYKQNSVKMASKEQLLLMLVDGAVKHTKVARLAIIDKNIPKAHAELIRVQDIFTELMITMDKSIGKYMEDVYKVYDFIKSELARANMKKDVNIIDNVLPLIEEVRNMWHEIAEKAKQSR